MLTAFHISVENLQAKLNILLINIYIISVQLLPYRRVVLNKYCNVLTILHYRVGPAAQMQQCVFCAQRYLQEESVVE